MTDYNDTPNLGEFYASDLELRSAILAFDEFIENIDEEHSSYHLLSTLNHSIKEAHNELTEHYTYEFERMFSDHRRKPKKGRFRLFQVVDGNYVDN